MSAAGRMVPGISEVALEREHVSRYRFACGFARGRDVLDAACGAGYAAPMFLEAGARSYLGIDISAEAVDLASQRYDVDAAISFVVDDACVFSHVRERAFDLVVSFETIEHVPEPKRFLANVSRALRPGGIFIVSTPCRFRYSPGNKLESKPWNPYHVQEWNQSEFLELLEPSFRVVQVLGQQPMPKWKAHVLSLSATRPWLKDLISKRHSHKSTAANTPSTAVSNEDLRPRPFSYWQMPLYTVCVTEARG